MGTISTTLKLLQSYLPNSGLDPSVVSAINKNLEQIAPLVEAFEETVESPTYEDVARALTSGLVGEAIAAGYAAPVLPIIIAQLAPLAAISPALPALVAAGLVLGAGWAIGEALDWALEGVAQDLADLLRDILSDPLVLDLDGDGIELTPLGSSTTMFDIDADGVTERTGWVSPQDGLLVHDINGNGAVDGVSELFGSANVDGYDELETIDANGDGRIDALDPAFADLRVWRDLNSDGVSTADEMLTLAQAGIARLNLAYTQVDTDVQGNIVAREGSYVRTDGTTRDMASVWFELDESVNRPEIPDGADLGNLIILPNLPASGPCADLRTAMFFDPTLKAMVEDLVFGDHDFDTFQEFADEGFIDVLYRWTGVDTTIPEDPEAPYYLQVFETLTGLPLEVTNDHQRERLEELWPNVVKQFGIQFLFQAAQSPSLMPFHELALDLAALDPQSPTFSESVAALTEAAVTEANAATPAYEYLEFFTGLTLDRATGAISGDFDAFVGNFIQDQPSFFSALGAAGGGGGDHRPSMAQGYEYRHPWTAWYEDQGSLLLHIADAMELGADYVMNVTGWRWLAGEATDLDGTVGNDLIDQAITYYWRAVGTTFVQIETRDQRMFGYEGDDELRGNDGVDRLVGGAGNDLLNGGSGSDMYVYASGDGLDRIVETSGEDTVYFSSELNSGDLRVALVAGTNDLLLHFGDPASGITLANQWSSTSAAIEQFHFVAEDGLNAGDIASLYLATLATAGADTIAGSWAGERLIGLDGNDNLSAGAGDDMLDGGVGADTLNGGDQNDTLFGGDGDDTLSGDRNNDRLIGGRGNDTLLGGSETDTYVYNLGDGDDALYDASYDSSPDELLILGEGITAENIQFSRVTTDWDDIRISFVGHAGSIVLDEQNQSAGIELIQFADGTIWDKATIYARYVAGQQTDGDDVIDGTEANDTIDGGEGNDLLRPGYGHDVLIAGAGADVLDGGSGVDTFIYNLGDGDDVIFDPSYDSSSGEVLIFGAGITSETLIFSRVTTDWDDIRISFVGHAGSIVIDEQNRSSGIEGIQFADGTIWDKSAIYVRYLEDQRTDGDDVIDGTEGNDSIDGGAGDDLLRPGIGHDVLTGGLGDDVLDGGSGVDTFIYNLGDGHDVIFDPSYDRSPDEVLQFGDGITASDLIFTRSAKDADDVVITFADFDGSIVFDEQARSSGVELIRFADGSVLTEAEFTALIGSTGALMMTEHAGAAEYFQSEADVLPYPAMLVPAETGASDPLILPQMIIA